jgi:hypothetical protein
LNPIIENGRRPFSTFSILSDHSIVLVHLTPVLILAFADQFFLSVYYFDDGIVPAELDLVLWAERVTVSGRLFQSWPIKHLMASDFVVGDIHYKTQVNGTCYVSGSQLARGSVVIPESVSNGDSRYRVTKLGVGAFFQNSSIAKISFDPNSNVFAFENACFRSSSLATLKLPTTLMYLHPDTFRQTPNLVSIVPGDNTKFFVDRDVLYDIERTSLVFCPRNKSGDFVVPRSVKRVGPWAFSQCKRLQSVGFDGDIDEFEDGAFSECGLYAFVIPRSVVRLGDFCFENCGSLAEIVFESPSQIVAIPQAAFAGCPLVNIRFPRSVLLLCNRCLAGTSFLKTVLFDEGSELQTILSDVFWGTSLEVLEIPARVDSIAPANFFATKCLLTLKLSPDNTSFTFAGNEILMTRNGRVVLFGLRSIREVAFPPDLEHVGANAFYECRGLSRVDFPAGLRSIGEGAFGFTSIADLVMPDSLVTIGPNAFMHCQSLVTCTFGPGSRLHTIGPGAFSCTGIEFFVVPGSVVDLGDQAFANSKLRSIRLPPSTRRVPPLLFFGCSELEQIIILEPRKFTFPPSCFEFTHPNIVVRVGPAVEIVSALGLVIDRSTPPADVPVRLPEYEKRAPPDSTFVSMILDPDDYTSLPGEVRSGGFGHVRKVVNRQTGRIAARKELSFQGLPNDFAQFIREIDALAKLAHPAILGLVGYIMPRKVNRENQAMIITEWLERGSLDGTLYDATKSRNLTPTMRAKIVAGIVLAMRFMHACGIAHRDMKPANILLDRKYEIRIADLGSARRMDLLKTQKVGTYYYLAPEMASSDADHKYDEKVDVFSFAIILWEIVSGQKAYANYAEAHLFQFLTRVSKGLRPCEKDDMMSMRQCTADLITSSWDNDPKHRPSFRRIFQILRKENYAILDDVDAGEVSRYVARILRFEKQFPARKRY